MMIKKERYIPPYIEIVEEEDNLLVNPGLVIGSGNSDDSKQAKGSSFFDDDDTTYHFIWDTDDPDEWEQ